MHMWIRAAISMLILACFTSLSVAANKVYVLEVNSAIGPATEDYIERGIDLAEKNQATLIILRLNTPGGLDSAMRGINAAIIASTVPVVAFVAPAGARAASAGTFILYASHLAAMAPGTNLGAASPINLMAPQTDITTMSTEQRKTINDAAAYIRSLAELRGRNANWGEQAVRKATSLSAEEALRAGVINVIADNNQQLLQKINGHTVDVLGATQTLNTQQLQWVTVATDWRYQFLSFITNPTVAYLLLLVAIYGLFFEFANPGLVLPGVAGLIALLVVLYAFQLMPINYAGLALILVGIGFLLFEFMVTSFGMIGIGGLIAFIIGSVMLFDVHDANYALTWPIIGSMSLVTILFFLMIITLALRSHKKKIITGQEGLIGCEGVVLSIMNEQVVVRIKGEIWEAKSSHPLKIGQEVKVTSVHGLTLGIDPCKK